MPVPYERVRGMVSMVYSGGTRVIYKAAGPLRIPVLHGARHVRTLQWQKTLALMPVLAVAAGLAGWTVWAHAGVCAAAAILAEHSACLWLKKKPAVHDGSSVFYALLLALVLPAGLPFWAAALGAFGMIFFGKELCGGFGQHPFFPPALGYLFLRFGCPALLQSFEAAEANTVREALAAFESLSRPAALQTLAWFHGGTFAEASLAALLAGGLCLLWNGTVLWELPLIFILSLTLTAAGLTPEGWQWALSGPVLLCAFYAVSDASSTPMTRSGRRLASAAAGMVTALLGIRENLHPFAAAALVSASAPWLEAWTGPRPKELKTQGSHPFAPRISVPLRSVVLTGVWTAAALALALGVKAAGERAGILFFEHPAGFFTVAALLVLCRNRFFARRHPGGA